MMLTIAIIILDEIIVTNKILKQLLCNMPTKLAVLIFYTNKNEKKNFATTGIQIRIRI
jgi:hypothetical protein